MFAIARLALILTLLAAPLTAQDLPDMASLPILTQPGSLTAEQMQHQAAWLDVAEPGLYRLTMDGPGLLGLTGFRTPNGRSDGSDPQERLVQDGDAYRPGVLDDLLLEPGHAYFLQTGAASPRGVTLTLIQPIDPATALSGDAMPGLNDQTWPLAPGTTALLRPGDNRTLTLSTNPALRIEAILPPGADASAHYRGHDIGPGGIYPLTADPGADLRVAGHEGAEGRLPLMLIRVTAAPDATLDEAEPLETNWGAIPPQGRSFRGVLLARSDRDDVDLTLDHATAFDLSLTVQDKGAAQLRLFRVDDDGFHLRLDASTTRGRILRRALTLPPGTYRLEISGERLHPSPYALSLAPADPGPGRPEGEPDDSRDMARELAPGSALRGALAEGDPAHVTFTVPLADHLWELRGVQGLTDLALTDGNDRDVGSWRASQGALVLRLGLNPGTYLAQLRGNGPYALRLADLGPKPEGFEAEPNEDEAAAMPLRPGMGLAGDFQSQGDFDLYELTLAAPTPLTLTVTPPDDGTLRAELDLDGIGNRVTDVAPETGPLDYTATFPIGRHLIRLSSRDDGVSGRYALRLTRADLAPSDEPLGHMAMPGDGRLAGTLGGFDGQDRVFVALPAGAGTMALTCQGAPDWSLVALDDQVLARAGSGQVVMLDYGPDLGGAVDLVLDGGAVVAPWACRAAFAAPGQPLPTLTHDEGADEATLTAVTPGQRISGSFADDRDGDRFAIMAPEGTLLGLRCDTLPDLTRPFGGDHLAQGLGASPLPDGSRVFVAEAAQAVELFPREGGFPQAWACDVLDQFATPAQMGPPAPLTRPAPAGLIQAGRPDWLMPAQITDDLDMTLAVGGLEQPFRAYSRLAQASDLVLTVQNPGAAREVTLEVSALAEGWHVTPGVTKVSVPAEGQVQVTLMLTLPPMQSGASDPQLRVVATATGQRGALTVPVVMNPATPERGGQRFVAAPDGLRGGLDPLRFALGGRVLTLDGAVVEPLDWAFLHDGDAPHSDTGASLAAVQVVFELAGAAPVVAVQTHLRTTEDRARWPAALTWELSADGQVWGPPLTQTLTASDLPQVMALPAPVTARFARLTRHGCRADPACGSIALAEVGLVAAPDWRPAGGLDLANPDLGGHVVTARVLGGRDTRENPFGGNWNADFLTMGSPDRLPRASDSIGTKVEVIVAFASNRAARVAAVDWVGAAEDAARLPQIAMDYSLTGPAGPWSPMPALPAPAPGQAQARLTLPAPQWMRALRLTMTRDAEQEWVLPDSIRLWEDPKTPSILGIWQDDAPEAGYEEAFTQTATPPIGGPDAAGAVTLALGQQVTSSVQLERNEDWWRITVPPGPKQMLTLHFPGAALPEFTASLTAPDGTALPLSRATTPEGDLILTAPADPGPHLLHISEPPRNVAILWDTSDSVGPYIPRILGAVRLWAMSLKPGRDRIQLLPFGVKEMLLPDWADHPDQVAKALADLPETNSSDAENAMGVAATALSAVDGQRGIVIITDAETSQGDTVWTPLLAARPRVVSLSIDSSDPRGVAFLKDWSAINGGYFTRVTGSAGLADGLDLAAALFRAPKPYALTASLTEIREPEGQTQLTLTATKPKRKAKPTGGIEVVLDASGSMLKRMEDGQRRIAVAHDALSHLVTKTLPKGTPFAFRAFGLAPDDCSSELKLPFAPLNPKAAEKAIRATPAVNLAKTAIAASLAAAAQDLAQTAPPRVIVLVTDGEETCDGDVAAEIARMRNLGLDIRLSIVGFAVDDAGLAQTFGQWAEQGGGRFVPAGDSAALTAALGDATLPRFAADRLYLDGRVETLGTLKLDEALTLPAGTYRLRPLQTALGAAVQVTLTDGQPLTLSYDPETGLKAE